MSNSSKQFQEEVLELYRMEHGPRISNEFCAHIISRLLQSLEGLLPIGFDSWTNMKLISSMYRARVTGLIATIEDAFSLGDEQTLLPKFDFEEMSMADIPPDLYVTTLGRWMRVTLRISFPSNFRIYPLFLLPLQPKYEKEMRVMLGMLNNKQARAVAEYVNFAADMGDNAARRAWTMLWSEVFINGGKFR